jgi:hypothetical protein
MTVIREYLTRPVTAPLWVYAATALAAFVLGVLI